MPLFARSFQELMTDAINDLAQNTNLTRLSPGGLARAILEAVNKRMAEAYETFDLNLARAFVSSAPGQFLELIGILLGVTRNISSAATADLDSEILKFYVSTGTFGDINSGSDIFIPQGTLLSTEAANGGTLYRTTGEYTLLSGQSSGFVSAEAAIPGEDSNVGNASLLFHDFTTYTDTANNTLLVTNLHSIANGENIESDDNYRFRIVNRVLESEAANRTAIRLAILTTPGVADVVMIPRYKGIGTVGAILKATLPTVSQTLIDSVTANVMKVMALGDIAYIRGPKEVGLTMKITVHYDRRLLDNELTLIEETLINTITDFVNTLDIGEDFNMNRMVAELFAVDNHISNMGKAGKPIDELYIHTLSRLEDTKVRQTLLGDYDPATDERVIIEPSVATPILLARAYTRR